MKSFAIASVLVALASSNVSFAQDKTMGDMDMKKCMEMKGMDMKDMDMKSCMGMMNQSGEGKTAAGSSANGTVHKATGVIKSVDTQKKMVTLAHDPVESLKWPAMTMGFAVRDKALFDSMSVGKKVDVEFVKDGGNYVITGAR